jgi:2-polyprenyl-3-methyl-5-hydroxy-6-metoxy-1,4-benzoquinol methylase
MRITPAYLEEQKRLHADPRGYGGKGSKWAGQVAAIAFGCGAASILDYGCGQGSLMRALMAERIDRRWRLAEYDPAIPGKDGEPMFADLVVCTDVLEHVEEQCLPHVLEDLAHLTRRQLFVVISTVETSKTLSDGRQAHITLHPRAWWIERFESVGMRVVESVIVNKPGKEFGLILEHQK